MTSRLRASVFPRPHALPLAALAALLAACGGGGPVDVQSADRVPLRLEKSDPETLVRSVLGGYSGADGADPWEAGLVEGEGADLTLLPQALAPNLRAGLADSDGNGVIGPDEWTAWIEATYYEARGLPLDVAGLRLAGAAFGEGTEWFVVEVDGVMTAARRRLYIPDEALRSAVEAFVQTGTMTYPEGTWIIGEHLLGDTIVETTAKRRRADGFWDFAVYGPDGVLAPATQTEPRALRTPTQCTGCHLGQKLYEPEKSWPNRAEDGPFGPRTYHVPASWRNAEATALFQEHARRQDGVLGLYGTLYASRLIADRAAGTISETDAALLDRLGL